MHKKVLKLYFCSFLVLFLCKTSVSFWVQLNSDNLFNYCEYYKVDWIMDETTMLCDMKDINWIEPGTFDWYDNVINLQIWSNNIDTLKSNTFAGLDNLESLTLSDNQIRPDSH